MSSSSSTKWGHALVMIGGHSGIGKTATVNALLARYSSVYKRPKSITTRLPRYPEEPSIGEYRFVTETEFCELRIKGSLLNSDYVYGNWYGIVKEDLESCIASGYLPVKEIHPENHSAIRHSLGRAVSVLLEDANDKSPHGLRSERSEVDGNFFENLDRTEFDLVAKIVRGSIDETTEELHHALKCFTRHQGSYPSQKLIETVNRNGYDLVAAEFYDNLRVTTRNFHDASRPFFSVELSQIPSGSVCLEIGPGNGWLRSECDWPNIDYVSVELSPVMSSQDSRYGREVSASRLPFQTSSFDLVIASLADPFLFPAAIIEMRRVLKPGGRVIISTPAEMWARALRPTNALDLTTFVLRDGGTASVYSFARRLEDLVAVFIDVGLRLQKEVRVMGDELPLGQVVSPALTMAAAKLNLPLRELEILYGLVFSKMPAGLT